MDVHNDRLRPVRYQQWVRDRVLVLHREPAGLFQQWATARGRKELRELLMGTLHFEIDELAARLRRPDCDPIDLLIYLGWEWPLYTRAERVVAFNVTERDYLDFYSPRARQVLATLLEKYAAHGAMICLPARCKVCRSTSWVVWSSWRLFSMGRGRCALLSTRSQRLFEVD
jgi:type I restriction enzyme, R subunit